MSATTDANKERNEVLKVLKLIIQATKGGVPLDRVEREYMSITEEGIPYHLLGCSNLLQLLERAKNEFMVTYARDGTRMVQAKGSAETAHILNMISAQKGKKKKPTRPTLHMNQQRNRFQTRVSVRPKQQNSVFSRLGPRPLNGKIPPKMNQDLSALQGLSLGPTTGPYYDGDGTLAGLNSFSERILQQVCQIISASPNGCTEKRIEVEYKRKFSNTLLPANWIKLIETYQKRIGVRKVSIKITPPDLTILKLAPKDETTNVEPSNSLSLTLPNPVPARTVTPLHRPCQQQQLRSQSEQHPLNSNNKIVNADGGNKHILNAYGDNKLIVNAYGDSKHIVNAYGGNKHIVNADGANKHIVNADGANNNIVNADGANKHIVNADGANKHIVNADGANKHIVSADGANNNIVNADGANNNIVNTDRNNSNNNSASLTKYWQLLLAVVYKMVSAAPLGLSASRIELNCVQILQDILPEDWIDQIRNFQRENGLAKLRFLNPSPGKWIIRADEPEARSADPAKKQPTLENAPKFNCNDFPQLAKISLPESNHWALLVSCVESPSTIWIRLYGEDYLDKWNNLSINMTRYYSNSVGSLTTTDIDTKFVYVLLYNGEWQRATIVSFKGNNVECFLIDEGQRVRVGIKELRLANPQFLKLAPQAVQMTLGGVKGDVPDCYLPKLRDLIENKPFIGVVGPDQQFIELFDTKQTPHKNMNKDFAKLVEQGISG